MLYCYFAYTLISCLCSKYLFGYLVINIRHVIRQFSFEILTCVLAFKNTKSLLLSCNRRSRWYYVDFFQMPWELSEIKQNGGNLCMKNQRKMLLNVY